MVSSYHFPAGIVAEVHCAPGSRSASCTAIPRSAGEKVDVGPGSRRSRASNPPLGDVREWTAMAVILASDCPSQLARRLACNLGVALQPSRPLFTCPCRTSC